MENIDVLVLRTLLAWRSAGHQALLATVVRTWGSSPRPIGSIMAIRGDGVICGSVSGGCIEDDLLNRYCVRYGSLPFPHFRPQLLVYGIGADEAHKFGLPCGGTLEIALEFDCSAESLMELVGMLDEGRLVRRTLDLHTGEVTLLVAQSPTPFMSDDQLVSNTFGPEYRMLLIGGGQLTEYIATMALFCGFKVVVCDPRDEHRATWSIAGVELTNEMPDDAVRAMRLDRRCCVIALTHDPKLDDLALLEALSSEVFYVGAIGSRRNAQSRRDRMIEHFDQTDESMAKLHSPIGLYIGSKTPPEIAVSIMAEVIAARNSAALPQLLQVQKAKEMLAI